MDRNDQYYMELALVEAQKALRAEEVPVGALVVSGEKIISRAYNQCIAFNDPTAHAEIISIRKACQKLKNYRLTECEIYVTLEPCPMCVGAIVLARIKRLVYGVSDPKGGGVHSILEFPFEKTNHSAAIESGILEKECRKILKDFFRAKR